MKRLLTLLFALSALSAQALTLTFKSNGPVVAGKVAHYSLWADDMDGVNGVQFELDGFSDNLNVRPGDLFESDVKVRSHALKPSSDSPTGFILQGYYRFADVSGGGELVAFDTDKHVASFLDPVLIYSRDGLKQYPVYDEVIRDVRETGDVNGDKEVNVGDAVRVLQGIVGQVVLSETDKWYADVDRSGSVDVRDAIIILRKSLGVWSD